MSSAAGLGRFSATALLVVGAASACESAPTAAPRPAPTAAAASASKTLPSASSNVVATAPAATPKASASARGNDPAALPSSSSECPASMALVSGSYCPLVRHRCMERPPNHGRGPKHHCKRYGKATCLQPNKRRSMRFCMDRFEWPNQKGELPRTLVSWPEARKLCASKGKRLCTADEFNFACEGEQMRPHVYGFERRDDICNSDRPYRRRTYNYKRWDECMKLPACKKEYARLDQRVPAGSNPRCVNEHGIFDLNGNANEWVFREHQKFPKRSGLKGGWWGPVRNRCRPMTTFHLEGDYGYEVGFRCCKDAG